MKKDLIYILTVVFIMMTAIATLPAGLSAEETPSVKLPQPRIDGGMPLMLALQHRSSDRDFSPEKLPLQVLSDLLWAADGINRPDVGKKTAPSARNWQEIDIYVATEAALYRYDAKDNRLITVLEEDIREYTGKQGFVKTAPLNLIYVADYAKIESPKPEDKIFYSAADTGFISQNVYLFCASFGLHTVVRAYIDKPALEKKMGLSPEQKVILSQTVGYPKK